MKTYFKSGTIIDYTAGSAISSGDVVVIGGLIGLAVNDIANGDTGPVYIAGAVSVTKATGAAWTIGADIYYDSGSANFTTTSTGNSRAGVAFKAAASGATSGYLLLNATNPSIATAEIADEAVTVAKMADLAQGSILTGQASDRPAALAAETDGQILIGDGTDLASVAVSGDITITNAGVTTIGADKVDIGMITAGGLDNVIADPGNGAAIPVTKSGSIAITTAGAETNTLAIPTFVGQQLSLICDVYAVGDRVVTVAAAVNQTGNNTLTFGAAADHIVLVGAQVAGALVWRVLANDGVGLTTV